MAQLPDNPDALYGDVIMEHYRSPRHRARISAPDSEAEEFNPFCGDRATLQLRLSGHRANSGSGSGSDSRNNSAAVAEVSAVAEGCSIIQASASLLADSIAGRTVAEVSDLSQLFRELMQGRPLPAPALAALGELAALAVVRRYPVRVKCALLPWVALEEALRRLG